ncbi:MAG: T9SS type A sorting domain-containing protein [Candidatus Latescibacterota bacterium]
MNHKGFSEYLIRASAIIIAVVSVFLAGTAYGFDNSGKWTHYTSPVPQTDIKSIVSLPDGRICAGADSSFHIYDRVHWSKYSCIPMLNNQTPFYADSEGNLYFLDNNYLVTWNNGKLTRFDTVQLMDPVIAQAGKGLYYISSMGTAGGIFTFDGKTITKIMEGSARSVSVDATGKLWATMILRGSGYFSLITMENGVWSDYTSDIDPISPLGSNLTVQIAPDGAVWVCNDFSYGVYQNDSWSFKRNTQGNPFFLTFDHSGRVWGYSYQQLFLLDSSGLWTVSRVMQNTPSGTHSYMAVAPDSTVWTFDTHRVYTYTGKLWKEVKNSNDLASDVITCLAYSGDGTLICGHGLRGLDYSNSEHLGVSVRGDTSWVNYNMYNWLQIPDVYDLETQQSGDVIAYTNNGFLLYNGGAWSEIDTLKTFKETDMIQDKSTPNSMWIGTTDGLLNYLDPIFTCYPPPRNVILWPAVYNICVDDEGSLYMQGNYGSILYTDKKEWSVLSIGDGPSIMDFAVEGDGTLWAARNTELSKWAFKEWQKVIDLDTGRLVKFDDNKVLWFSGFGTTGYMEDGVVNIIPEISQSASDFITFADENIALNSFNRDRTKFYGFYEYTPESVKVEDNKKPVSFITTRCFPNPFNPTVTIQFELPKTEKASIRVYNIMGQLVRTIADHSFNAGVNNIQWDSRSDSGMTCSSGIYFYKIDAGDKLATGRMVLLR